MGKPPAELIGETDLLPLNWLVWPFGRFDATTDKPHPRLLIGIAFIPRRWFARLMQWTDDAG